MRKVLPLPLLLAALSLVGCSEDDERTLGGPPVPLEDFCTEFVETFCKRVAACDCSPTADADCRADLTSECTAADGILGTETRARLASGALVYNAAAAGALFARVGASNSCDNPLLSLDWTFKDAITFGGVFRGTVAPGGACTATNSPIGSDCTNGICQETMSGGVCIGLAALGAPCGMGMPFLCVDAEASFTGLENSDILLRCDVAAGASTGTCANRLANGATCSGGLECASNVCDGTMCAPQLMEGAGCSDNNECASGYCAMRDGAFCSTPSRGPNGASCNIAIECESNECRDNVCVPGICGLYDPPPSAV
jgi:hypothetical protein